MDNFGKRVIKQAKSNLTRKKKRDTNNLYDSLGYNLKETSSGRITVDFLMEEYGLYIDEGINGKKKNNGSQYSFTNKLPPIDDIAEWAKRKNIRLRDSKGKYKKGNYKSIGFVIARSIFEKGFKPTLFFTKAYDSVFKNLEDDILDAMADDIDREFRGL